MRSKVMPPSGFIVIKRADRYYPAKVEAAEAEHLQVFAWRDTGLLVSFKQNVHAADFCQQWRIQNWRGKRAMMVDPPNDW